MGDCYNRIKAFDDKNTDESNAGTLDFTNMLCAQGDNTDSCQGDSGGPLIKTGTTTQVGVTSWGIGCNRGVPSAYASVAVFADWIQTQISSYQSGDSTSSSGGSSTGDSGSTGSTGDSGSTGSNNPSVTSGYSNTDATDATEATDSTESTDYNYWSWAYTADDESKSDKLSTIEVVALVLSIGLLCCVSGALCFVCRRNKNKTIVAGVEDDGVIGDAAIVSIENDAGYDMKPIVVESTNSGENENDVMIEVPVTETNQ